MPAALQSLSLLKLAVTLLTFFVSWTLLSVALGLAMERLLAHRKIFAIPLFPGQYRFELRGNLVFILIVTAAFTAALGTGIVRFGPSSWLRNGLTFLALALGFQVYYWMLHRLMHLRSLVRFHRWHHRSQVTTPLTGQSVSAVEACGWVLGYVGLPLLFSLIVPIGFWGWAGYIAFNMFGNIIGHANIEPTSRAAATRNAALFAGPFVYHALHHARWTGHYSFQSALMDRLMGTEWPDWPALYDRIVQGKPMTSLKERGPESS